MPHRELKNKPLVEAILEVKWALESRAPGIAEDPHYKLLLGRLSDRVREDYPEPERLATAGIPDELVGHVVQYRFRTAPGQWPLIQVGPGILTVNETEAYVWDDFCERARNAMGKLFDAHPKRSELKIENLSLRYIDAVEFDYSSDDAFRFLKEQLKIDIRLPRKLFDGTTVEDRPKTFSWQSSFLCQAPAGTVHLRCASGQANGKPAVMMETTVNSAEEDLPSLPHEFKSWIDSAHEITHEWFFTLIEGDLERRFNGE